MTLGTGAFKPAGRRGPEVTLEPPPGVTRSDNINRLPCTFTRGPQAQTPFLLPKEAPFLLFPFRSTDRSSQWALVPLATGQHCLLPAWTIDTASCKDTLAGDPIQKAECHKPLKTSRDGSRWLQNKVQLP